MKSRLLCGALALFLIAAPVSGLWCGDCVSGHCLPPEEMAVMDGQSVSSAAYSSEGREDLAHSPAVEPVENAEPPPCHEAAGVAEAPKVSVPPCHEMVTDPAPQAPCHEDTNPAPIGSTGSDLASAACCDVAQTVETETSSTAAGPIQLKIALEPSALVDGSSLELSRFGTDALHHPPPIDSRPLYTLHSVFLI